MLSVYITSNNHEIKWRGNGSYVTYKCIMAFSMVFCLDLIGCTPVYDL